MKSQKHMARRKYAVTTMGAILLSFLFLANAPITAMANYNREEADDEATTLTEPEYEPGKVVTEESVKEPAEPFSIDGNGEVLDDATDDDTKEFLTVQTKNNQTFFVVIDRAATSNNVYMLSMIDESDLAEFLDENEESKAGLLLPQADEKTQEQIKEEEERQKELLAEQKRKSEKRATIIFVIILITAGIIFCGGYYYFKFYKPRREEEKAEEEHLEEFDEIEFADWQEDNDPVQDGYDEDEYSEMAEPDVDGDTLEEDLQDYGYPDSDEA